MNATRFIRWHEHLMKSVRGKLDNIIIVFHIAVQFDFKRKLIRIQTIRWNVCWYNVAFMMFFLNKILVFTTVCCQATHDTDSIECKLSTAIATISHCHVPHVYIFLRIIRMKIWLFWAHKSLYPTRKEIPKKSLDFSFYEWKCKRFSGTNVLLFRYPLHSYCIVFCSISDTFLFYTSY